MPRRYVPAFEPCSHSFGPNGTLLDVDGTYWLIVHCQECGHARLEFLDPDSPVADELLNMAMVAPRPELRA